MPAPRGPADTTAEALVWVLTFFCPLALATSPGWAAIAAAVLASAAFLAAVFARARRGRPLEIPGLGLVFLAILGVVTLQLVPLPPFMLRVLSPRANELFEFSLGPLGRYPAWRPVSLDPPGTALALGRLGTAFLAYLAGVQVAGSRGGRRRLTLALGLAGLTVAVIGYGHALLRMDALFGVYRFARSFTFLTTFGNANHLASFLSLGAFAMLGLAWREEDRRRALGFYGAYLVQAIALLLTLSRGGIVSFLAAHLVFAALAQWTEERPNRPPGPAARALLVPIAASIAIAFAAYLGWEAIAARFGEVDSVSKLKDSKIALIPSVLLLIRDYWTFGVGRGAFAPAFQRYQPIATHTIQYPENWIAQQLSELGVFAGTLVVVSCLWAWSRAALRRRDLGSTIGCVSGAFAVGLHELVDFGTELGGVAVPLAVALAVATARPEQSSLTLSPRRWSVRTAVSLALSGLLMVTVWGSWNSLRADAARLVPLQADLSAAESLAPRLTARHPADYSVPLTMALAFARESPLRPDRVLPWANRAMYLNPLDPWPHRLAARSLLRLGRLSQAQLEYRLALASVDADVLAEIMETFNRPEDLLGAIPDDGRFVKALLEMMERPGKRDLGLATARMYVDRGGDAGPILLCMAEFARSVGRFNETLDYAERALARDRTAPQALIAKAQALSGLGRPGEGAEAALEAMARSPVDLEMAIAASPMLVQGGQGVRAREWLVRSLPFAHDKISRARGFVAEAQTFLDEKNAGYAIESLRSAIRDAPEYPEGHWALIALLEGSGRLHESLAEIDAFAPLISGADRNKLDAARTKVQAELTELKLYEEQRNAGGAQGKPSETGEVGASP